MKAIGVIILLLIVVFFVIYAIAPVYKFSDAEVFSGDKIHNPYQDMDSANWKKGNFQVQSRAWMGITNGRNNSNEAIQIVYKQLGYDIIVTSDYMKINDFGEGNTRYIPTYEHGYSIRKVHQVCIGSKNVNWIDYPFYQNISHKQHIINILRENNDIVTLAHPDLRDGYLLDDMRKLSNYDLIEVLNEIRKSPHHWDAALSNGHSAYILANDDAHDVFDPTEVGRMCTFINTESLDSKNVIAALKSGKAFGADIAMRQGADLVEKAEDHKRVAVLKNVSVLNDTLFVELSKKARLFAFIGQNGIVKSNVVDTNVAFYPIALSDTYVRTEITFDNGNKFYLNPVYRYSGDAPVKQLTSKIDYVKTWVQRGVALIFIIIIIIIIARISKRNPSKGRIRQRSNNYYIR